MKSLRRGAGDIAGREELDARRSVIFVRHAQTAWACEGRYQGRSDPPLSRQGIEEAKAVAARLRDCGIAAVISSPLSRALHTAQIIAAALNLASPGIEPHLMEVAYGDWEGLTQQEVRARWPRQLRQWKSAPAAFEFPGGESLAAASARLFRFLGEQYARFDADPRPIVAVTHCGLIRLAVLEACAAPIERFRHVRVEHGSAHRFVLQSRDTYGKWSLWLEGDSCAASGMRGST